MDEIDSQKESVLDFCDELWKSARDPEFLKEDPQSRYEFIMNKYPTFCQAYPMISKYMVIYLKYNRKAMKKFLDRLQKQKGGGMEAFCELQAEYVKFLYIEEEKALGHHVDVKRANQIKQQEFKEMYKFIKDMKKLEKEETKEYEKEQNELLDEKRHELLDFLETVDPATTETTSLDSLSMPELMALYHKLREYELKLMEELDEKNRIIDSFYNKPAGDWIPKHLRKY